MAVRWQSCPKGRCAGSVTAISMSSSPTRRPGSSRSTIAVRTCRRRCRSAASRVAWSRARSTKGSSICARATSSRCRPLAASTPMATGWQGRQGRPARQEGRGPPPDPRPATPLLPRPPGRRPDRGHDPGLIPALTTAGGESDPKLLALRRRSPTNRGRSPNPLRSGDARLLTVAEARNPLRSGDSRLQGGRAAGHSSVATQEAPTDGGSCRRPSPRCKKSRACAPPRPGSSGSRPRSGSPRDVPWRRTPG
jgi:hypothetical protein